MATIASLYDLTLPYLPGAEIGVLKLHARRALREFLRRTTVWRQTLAFNTVDGSPKYLYAPLEGEVCATFDVRIDGESLPVLPEHLRPFRSSTGRPRGWYNVVPTTVSLYPSPDGVHAIEADVALTLALAPVMTADDTFPDSIMAAYGEEIAAGVLGYMLAMPGKPWTQVSAAADYKIQFNNAMHTIRSRLRDGGRPNASTATGPRITSR